MSFIIKPIVISSLFVTNSFSSINPDNPVLFSTIPAISTALRSAINSSKMFRNYFSVPKWSRWSSGNEPQDALRHQSASQIPQVLSSHVSIQIIGIFCALVLSHKSILTFKRGPPNRGRIRAWQVKRWHSHNNLYLPCRPWDMCHDPRS